MLSTPDIKRGVRAGFEHPRPAPVPLVPQGRASRPASHRTFAACVLRHAAAVPAGGLRELLQFKEFSKNFELFFCPNLLSKMHENWHGYLFLTSLNFLIGTSRRCRDFVARSARRCQGDSAALSWCCHIVLYIYDENSTLGLKTVYKWQ